MAWLGKGRWCATSWPGRLLAKVTQWAGVQLVEQRLYLYTPASDYQAWLHFPPPLPQLP